MPRRRHRPFADFRIRPETFAPMAGHMDREDSRSIPLYRWQFNGSLNPPKRHLRATSPASIPARSHFLEPRRLCAIRAIQERSGLIWLGSSRSIRCQVSIWNWFMRMSTVWQRAFPSVWSGWLIRDDSSRTLNRWAIMAGQSKTPQGASGT